MGKKVFVNGTFDIIHLGHLSILNFAKSLGNHLTVAIDSDRRVKELKGKLRPINTETERKELLVNLKAVDEVLIFNSAEELENIIKSLMPDYMVIGSDYKDKKVIGSQFAKELIFYDRIAQFSSTEKIQSIINR